MTKKGLIILAATIIATSQAYADYYCPNLIFVSQSKQEIEYPGSVELPPKYSISYDPRYQMPSGTYQLAQIIGNPSTANKTPAIAYCYYENINLSAKSFLFVPVTQSFDNALINSNSPAWVYNADKNMWECTQSPNNCPIQSGG